MKKNIKFWALYAHINQFFMDGGTLQIALSTFTNIEAVNFFYNYNKTQVL